MCVCRSLLSAEPKPKLGFPSMSMSKCNSYFYFLVTCVCVCVCVCVKTISHTLKRLIRSYLVSSSYTRNFSACSLLASCSVKTSNDHLSTSCEHDRTGLHTRLCILWSVSNTSLQSPVWILCVTCENCLLYMIPELNILLNIRCKTNDL